ncbi:hypothetical protein [Pseudomonas nunensis]|nr:hypothetical protein [Pseudomonas nunensis]MDN3218790.1 hypothetical protein [Pseudomonas nunensis]
MVMGFLACITSIFGGFPDEFLQDEREEGFWVIDRGEESRGSA